MCAKNELIHTVEEKNEVLEFDEEKSIDRYSFT